MTRYYLLSLIIHILLLSAFVYSLQDSEGNIAVQKENGALRKKIRQEMDEKIQDIVKKETKIRQQRLKKRLHNRIGSQKLL